MFDKAGTACRIRDLRGEVPQREFAERLNFKQTYISEIETGKTKPSIEFLVSLSDSCNTTVDYILKGGKFKKIKPVELTKFSKKIRRLNEELTAIHEEINTT